MTDASLERTNEHFKKKPLSVYADQLMQHTALNEFICSTGETLEDCTKIIDFFEKKDTNNLEQFEEDFLATLGFELYPLERYEDMPIETLVNSVLELYLALKGTVHRIICDREISAD